MLQNLDFGAPRKQAKIVAHPGRQMRSPRAAAQHHPFHYSLGRGRPFNYETTAQNSKDSRCLSAPPMASSRAKVHRVPGVSRAERGCMITQGRDARRAPRPQLSPQQQQHTQPAGRRGAIEWSEANKMAAAERRGIFIWDQTWRR